MSHDKKPDGYYDDFSNLARKIYQFVEAHELSSRMPTPGQLWKADESGLVKAVVAHGGFPKNAPYCSDSSLIVRRKATGRRKPSTSKSRSTLWRVTDSPSLSRRTPSYAQSKRDDLSVAISRCGGGKETVAQRLGLRCREPEPRRWKNADVLDAALLDFVKTQGTPELMPTQEELTRALRTDIANAIYQLKQTWPRVAERLNLRFPKNPNTSGTTLKTLDSRSSALTNGANAQEKCRIRQTLTLQASRVFATRLKRWAVIPRSPQRSVSLLTRFPYRPVRVTNSFSRTNCFFSSDSTSKITE